MNWEIGTTQATTNNHVYVTLRLGKITESSKEPREGFFPAVTHNNSGEEYHFFARTFDNLTGYVKGLRWYQNALDNGTILKGWKITINVGEDKDYILDIGDKQRPFNDFMSRVANVDFTRPVRFIGFTGKDGRKVLLLTQDRDADTNKPIWVQPKFDMKFLSRFIIDKLKAKEALSPDEERNIARDDKGKILPQMKYDEIDGVFTEGYPYVFQNASDDKWNFSVWTAFLIDFTKTVTIPRLESEVEHQPVLPRKVTAQEDDLPEFSGESPTSPPHVAPSPYDDEIPF